MRVESSKRKAIVTTIAFFMLLISSCENNIKLSSSEKDQIRKSIQRSLDIGAEATRTEDIDLYMAGIPDDLVVKDESGEVITKGMLREHALRDWAIVDNTLEIQVLIDSLIWVNKDSTIVYTSQKWGRTMFQRDGVSIDTVLTTQHHKEVWKRIANEWFAYQVQELGGEVFVNGEAYNF